ncbi:hypothetical protein CBOM_04100 [Ceraceosorus bombacis]|uniref:Uncharacterized protein n=1 Tax=Ceraceosorus bombacis TaxID=401625 RepID=A0A0P1BMS0_9BASI|nr:hypothetical protein CBOM_04100 [Ceraceosorus bombacis]
MTTMPLLFLYHPVTTAELNARDQRWRLARERAYARATFADDATLVGSMARFAAAQHRSRRFSLAALGQSQNQRRTSGSLLSYESDSTRVQPLSRHASRVSRPQVVAAIRAWEQNVDHTALPSHVEDEQIVTQSDAGLDFDATVTPSRAAAFAAALERSAHQRSSGPRASAARSQSAQRASEALYTHDVRGDSVGSARSSLIDTRHRRGFRRGVRRAWRRCVNAVHA